MLELIRDFNQDYASAVGALTPIVIGIVSFMYYGVYKESKLKSQNKVYIKPVFYGFGNNYRVDSVKRFTLSEDKCSYVELETLSTAAMWERYIEIKHCIFRTVVRPKRQDDILAVTIKRKPYENWKVIYFNR